MLLLWSIVLNVLHISYPLGLQQDRHCYPHFIKILGGTPHIMETRWSKFSESHKQSLIYVNLPAKFIGHRSHVTDFSIKNPESYWKLNLIKFRNCSLLSLSLEGIVTKLHNHKNVPYMVKMLFASWLKSHSSPPPLWGPEQLVNGEWKPEETELNIGPEPNYWGNSYSFKGTKDQ